MKADFDINQLHDMIETLKGVVNDPRLTRKQRRRVIKMILLIQSIAEDPSREISLYTYKMYLNAYLLYSYLKNPSQFE